MYTTLVEEFVSNGHEVLVIAPGDLPTSIRQEKGISVLRVKTLPVKNVPYYIKGISNVLLPFQYERALKKFYSKKAFDLIISPTPPITLADLAARLKKKYNAPFYLILRDIFPQNAIDLGFMTKGGLLHRYFRKKEAKLYKHADFIGCMSKGNVDYVRKHNPELQENKLHELKNFQKLYHGFGSDYQALRQKYGLKDKFVVVFGGNMGKPQQLENVLKLAESCKALSDVVFLLLGEGVHMDRIAQISREQKLDNIIIQQTISKQEYQDLISSCNVGLISLHENFTIPNIPSKALDYFNVGIPVLASIDRVTDFGEILIKENAGLWSFAGDHEAFYSNFLILYKNESLRFSMGLNGKEYFRKNLTPETTYQTIMLQLA